MKYKFGEIVLDTTQNLRWFLKNKTIFHILCAKIEDSPQKYHILILNKSINSYKSLLQVGID